MRQIIKINGVITTGITLLSNIVIYYLAVKSGIDQSSYFAFMSAYGMVMGAFLQLSNLALSAAAGPAFSGDASLNLEGSEMISLTAVLF